MPDDVTEPGNPDNGPEIDVETYVAKIAELESTLEANATTILDLTNALNAAKAANYDLLTQVPSNDTPAADADDDDDDADSDDDIDDLFGDNDKED